DDPSSRDADFFRPTARKKSASRELGSSAARPKAMASKNPATAPEILASRFMGGIENRKRIGQLDRVARRSFPHRSAIQRRRIEDELGVVRAVARHQFNKLDELPGSFRIFIALGFVDSLFAQYQQRVTARPVDSVALARAAMQRDSSGIGKLEMSRGPAGFLK